MPIMVASVTMNGWIRSVAITAPFTLRPRRRSARGNAIASNVHASSRLSGPGRVSEHRDQRGGERQDAAHAQIDAAGQNHERHGQRDDADQRNLAQDVGQIAGLQKDARAVARRAG